MATEYLGQASATNISKSLGVGTWERRLTGYSSAKSNCFGTMPARQILILGSSKGRAGVSSNLSFEIWNLSAKATQSPTTSATISIDLTHILRSTANPRGNVEARLYDEFSLESTASGRSVSQGDVVLEGPTEMTGSAIAKGNIESAVLDFSTEYLSGSAVSASKTLVEALNIEIHLIAFAIASGYTVLRTMGSNNREGGYIRMEADQSVGIPSSTLFRIPVVDPLKHFNTTTYVIMPTYFSPIETRYYIEICLRSTDNYPAPGSYGERFELISTIQGVLGTFEVAYSGLDSWEARLNNTSYAMGLVTFAAAPDPTEELSIKWGGGLGFDRTAFKDNSTLVFVAL